MSFYTTWEYEDGSIGVVVPSKALYWTVNNESITSEKEYHDIIFKFKGDVPYYFEVDGTVYLNFDGDSPFIPNSRWYSISEDTEVVAE